MPSLDKIAGAPRVRLLGMGHPGTAKTGSLAALANAGYNLRVLDFDGNLESLIAFTAPEARARVEVVTLEDDLKGGDRFVEVKGEPTAFRRALQLLDNWKYDDVNFGPVKSWGRNEILVIDTLTGLGRAAMRRALFVNNRTIHTRRIQDWGVAISDQEAVVEKITSMAVPCHVIVFSHVKLVGPKFQEENDDNETSVGKVNKQIAETVPVRWYPSAIGQGLPTTIGEHFGVVVSYELIERGGKVQRMMRTAARADLDIKVPDTHIPPLLPVESGLLTIFEAIAGKLEVGGTNVG